MKSVAPKGLHRRIHDVVSRIPHGRIATYGQIARLSGIPRQARVLLIHTARQKAAIYREEVARHEARCLGR